MSFFEYHHLKALTENKNIKNHFRLSNVESEFRIICELKHEQFSIYETTIKFKYLVLRTSSLSRCQKTNELRFKT